MSPTRNTVEAQAVARARGRSERNTQRQGVSSDGETTDGCRIGSTRLKANNLTVGRPELIAGDLLRGDGPGSFVFSDRSNLPSRVNRFVGRHLELMGLQRALDTSGSVMLTGAAGVGRTRFGVEAGREGRHRDQAG